MGSLHVNMLWRCGSVAVILLLNGCRKEQAAAVQEIVIGSNTVLQITAVRNPWSDVTVSLCYQIQRNGTSVMDESYSFGAADSHDVTNLRFTVWQTKDKTLTAIAESSQPTCARIVYEANSGWNWPFCEYHTSDRQACYRNTTNLLSRIERDNDDKSFTLQGRMGDLLPRK
jgi:hypothetical protein